MSKPTIPSQPVQPVQTSRSASWLAAGALIIALTLSVLAWRSDAVERDSISSRDAIAAAAGLIADGFRPGDAVVVTPFWDDSLWATLQGIGEGTERFPFPTLFTSDRVDTIDLVRHDRLWVVGLHGRAAAPPPSLSSAVDHDSTTAIRVGPNTEIAVYALPTLEGARDMVSELKTLKVRRRLPSGVADPCPWKGGRHRCGREHWRDLHTQQRDVFHRDVDWLFAHPGPNDVALEIDWPALPGGRWILFRAGFTQASVRKKEGQPVTIRLRSGDALLDSFVLEPREYRLARRLVELPPGPHKQTLSVEVKTEEDGWRELMIQGVLIDSPQPPDYLLDGAVVAPFGAGSG